MKKKNQPPLDSAWRHQRHLASPVRWAQLAQPAPDAVNHVGGVQLQPNFTFNGQILKAMLMFLWGDVLNQEFLVVKFSVELHATLPSHLMSGEFPVGIDVPMKIRQLNSRSSSCFHFFREVFYLNFTQLHVIRATRKKRHKYQPKLSIVL